MTKLNIIVQVVFFLVTYVLPMVGLSVTYCHLGTVLWRDQAPHTTHTMGNRRKVRDKRKVWIIDIKIFS